MSTTSASRKETERIKLIQEKCQTLLNQMLRDEDNKYCVDCDAKGPRWASWNIGVFLCIRCAGIHRNLGVHISRVKSVNLDTWTPEQVISLQQMGNSRARAVYEAQLPDGFRRPQTDNALESFVRAKYEHKKYLAREWVAPSPPKVDWAKEIDEELERQKRKKKAAQANNALGIGVLGGTASGDKKSTTVGGSTAVKPVPLPAPLPKPKAGQSGSSPKTQRLTAATSSTSADQQNDLLGLSTPTKPTAQDCLGGIAAQDLQNDSFSSFLSAPVISDDGITDANKTVQNSLIPNSGAVNSSSATANTALAKEEQDFFNHGSLGANDKDRSGGKLTKDSILALYSAAPTNPHNPQLLYGPQQVVGSQYTQNSFGGSTGAPIGHNFTGMSPGFMGGGAGGALTQQQQHNPQFMTPPNSASMYNAPVMTAPTAFSTTGIGSGLHLGNTVMPVAGGGFGAQFPGMSHVGYPTQIQPIGIIPQHMATLGGSIMATRQTAATSSAVPQLMHSNNSRLGNVLPLGMMAGVMPQSTTQQLPQNSLNSVSIGSGMPIMGMSSGGSTGNLPAFQTSATGNSAGTIGPNANLNQQFGNLNIGNVWQ